MHSRFLDTRQSLEMKLLMEEQSKEQVTHFHRQVDVMICRNMKIPKICVCLILQERLLLSVLPEHLALKMRQDLGTRLNHYTF